jgi:hypothetical protein
MYDPTKVASPAANPIDTLKFCSLECHSKGEKRKRKAATVGYSEADAAAITQAVNELDENPSKRSKKKGDSDDEEYEAEEDEDEDEEGKVVEAQPEVPPPQHQEAWKNDLDYQFWRCQQHFHLGAESVGAAWEMDLEAARTLAHSIYNHSFFIEDNWPNFSTRSYAEAAAIWTAPLEWPLALTAHEQQYLAMQEDPAAAAACEIPFYIVRGLPGLVSLPLSSNGNIRPRTGIKRLSSRMESTPPSRQRRCSTASHTRRASSRPATTCRISSRTSVS